jgi:hypothetical protein
MAHVEIAVVFLPDTCINGPIMEINMYFGNLWNDSGRFLGRCMGIDTSVVFFHIFGYTFKI